MADIDTSTYPKSQSYDPLKTLGSVANLQNTINQNRLFQQEFQSKLGLSRIYKEAIKPDGTLDIDKLRALQASDPSVSYGLPEAYKGSQEAQQRNIAIDSAQLENANKHLTAVSGYYADLMKPGSTSKDVSVALGRALTNHIIEMPRLLELYSTLPRDQNGQIDESKVPQWAQQQQLQVMDVQQRINAMHPAPTMQDLPGGGKAPFVMPQIGQVQQVGDTIQPAPAPTTTTVGPDGTPRYIGNPQGNNPYEAAYQASQGRAAPTGGGIAPGGNIGGLPSALSPAASAAQSDTGHASAQAYAALKNEVGNAATQRFQLNQALTGLQGAPTGPGTETVNSVKSFLLAQSPDALKRFLPGVNVGEIKDRDKADKYLTAFASGQAGSFSPNTNEKLATALSANASTHISNLAAQDVVKANIGLVKMKQAQADAFLSSGLPAEKFSDWAVKWNKDTDPRAFIADQMSKKDRTDMINKMKPSEKTAFLNSVQSAIATGLVSLSDLRNGK